MSCTYPRRDILRYGSLFSLGGTSVLAGCTMGSAGGDGWLKGEVVDIAPPNATVVESDDERIADEQLLQSFIRETIREGNAVREVDEYKVNEISDKLSQLPRYQSTSQTDAPSGYYVKHNQTIVAVQFAIEE